MKLNFKTLYAVGALLCMGSVYAGENPSIDANPFCEKSNISTMTWEKFEKTVDEDLPKNIIIEEDSCIVIRDSNVDRLLKAEDRVIFPKRYNLVVDAKNCEAKRLTTFLSNIFSKSCQIDFLELSNFEAANVPKEIWNLTSLKYLGLGGISILSLPKQIENLTNLMIINLVGTSISNLPKEIGNLTRLIHIELSGTLISSLPKEIGNLKRLKNLGLCFNETLIDVPKEIEILPDLERVILDPRHNFSVMKFLEYQNGINFDGIESLDLSIKNLDRVPCDIVMLKDLKKLNLSTNNLESIPLFLRNVKNLEVLDISKNNVASLPTEIWPFPRTLKYLTIDGFLLKNIPDDRIESITNIHELAEGRVSRRGVLDLIVAKANHLPRGNKLMLQSLGGICTVKLKSLRKRSLRLRITRVGQKPAKYSKLIWAFSIRYAPETDSFRGIFVEFSWLYQFHRKIVIQKSFLYLTPTHAFPIGSHNNRNGKQMVKNYA